MKIMNEIYRDSCVSDTIIPIASKIEIENRKNMFLREQTLLNKKYEKDFLIRIMPALMEKNKIVQL